LQNIAKREQFEKQKIILLCPLVEVMIEQMEKKLLVSREENKKYLSEFAEVIQTICQTKQKLENKELNNIFLILENKSKNFLNHLEIKPAESILDVESEESSMEEIIKLIQNLEKKIETYHEITLAEKNQDNKEEISVLEENSQEKVTNPTIETKADDPTRDYEKMKALEEAQESDQLIAQIETPIKELNK